MAQVSEPQSDPFAQLAALDEQRHRASHESPAQGKALEEIRRELTASQPIKTPLSLGPRCWVMSGILLGGLLITSRLALQERPFIFLLAAIISSLGLSSLFALSFMPRRGAVASTPGRRLMLSLATLGTLAGLSFGAEHFLNISEHLITHWSLSCFSHVLLTGSLSSGVSALIWRRSDPYSPRLTGALLGAIGGLLGVLSVGMSCPAVEGWHLLFGHGLSVCTLALIGALLGPRILSP